MKRLLSASLIAVATVCGVAGAGGSGVTIDVRLVPMTAVVRIHYGETPRRSVMLVGRVASGAARESVRIEVRECGSAVRFFRSIGGASTTAGGRWQFGPIGNSSYSRRGDSGSYAHYGTVGSRGGNVGPSAHFRARWREAVSKPVLVRGPLIPEEWRVRKTRRGTVLEVDVSTRDTGQNVARRFVELQRRVSGLTGERWVRVRRARLKRVSQHYEAKFLIRTHGLVVRGYVPARTAAPCYVPGWTLPFES